MSVTRIDPGKSRELDDGRGPRRCQQAVLPKDGFQIRGEITQRWFPPEWPPIREAA